MEMTLQAASATLCRFATCRSSLLQRKMCSVIVVITDVLAHQAFQMPFVEHDYMVEQITPAVADPTLSNPVLPRDYARWSALAGCRSSSSYR